MDLGLDQRYITKATADLTQAWWISCSEEGGTCGSRVPRRRSVVGEAL
jgi:hypothetical protein